jgi:hypothetical protein
MAGARAPPPTRYRRLDLARRQSKQPDEPSPAEMRGVVSFDYDGISVHVRADVEPVARALSEVRGARVWEQDVIGREVALGEQCFVVFRLNGHTWTHVLARDRHRRSVGESASAYRRLRDLDAEDARALSEQLGTRAIYYGVSDTALALVYHVYDGGALVERLETGEGYDIDVWESTLHAVQADQIEDVEEWVDGLFREFDALEPGMHFTHFAGYILHKPGDTIPFSDPLGLCERLDFVAC